MPILHSSRIAASSGIPEQWMLLLHGIYGAGRNWSAVASRYAADRPEWGFVPVDLRQHGRSQGFEPPHTLARCVDDLKVLVSSTGLAARGILGHSLGGKVALLYAAAAEYAPERVWVIDSTPDARPPAGGAYGMLEILERNPGPFPDRSSAIAALEAEGLSHPVAQWMATNVEPAGDGYAWRIAPEDMRSLIEDAFATDAWGIVEKPRSGCQIHFVRALDSAVMTAEAVERIRAAGAQSGQVFLHEVEGGHWLNVDNPHALNALLMSFN